MTTYAEDVARRLSDVYTSGSVQQGRELADLRLVLFSDLHKGQKDNADDFQQCRQTYLSALPYYWERSFELALLGDVEELWENWPQPVIQSYGDVLSAEKAFAEAQRPSRYLRFVGNHDDMWYSARDVERHLGPYLAGHLVIEALRIQVHDQGQPLGELFFVHGHQGSLDSDRYAGLSALVVRLVWRPIQRMLNIKTSTPSTDFKLRQKHEQAMYSYAASQSGLVLIAGHTHHPVWEGLGFEQAVQEMRSRGREPQVSPAWMQDQTRGAVRLPGKKPCYFNTGCCCYSDGSITGIEIEAGEIRLIRWEVFAQPVRTELFSASLREVLAAVAAPA